MENKWIDIDTRKPSVDNGPIEVKGTFGTAELYPFLDGFLPLVLNELLSAENTTHWRRLEQS